MNQHLTKFQSAMIRHLKNETVEKKEYEIAAKLRELEKDCEISAEDTIKKYDELIIDVQEMTEKYSRVNNVAGDKYKVSEEAAIEADKIIQLAHELRSEADSLLRRTHKYQVSAFDLLRKDNPNIPKDVGLVFIKETNSVVVVTEPQ